MKKVMINAVYIDTGEVISEPGVYKTEEEIRKTREFFQEKDKKEFQRQCMQNQYKEYGKFYWLLYKEESKLFDLDYNCIMRFLYLCTYMNNDNVLMFDNNRLITYKNLESVLNLKETQMRDLINELKRNNLIDDRSGKITISTNRIQKGYIKNIRHKNDNTFIRIYREPLQYLYHNINVREHKLLGYLYCLIPYINKNYNVLSKNTKEVELEKIEPLTMKEICQLLGYSEENASRLKKALLEISLINHEKTIVSRKIEKFNTMLFVNPKLYFKGNEEQMKQINNIVKFKNEQSK